MRKDAEGEKRYREYLKGSLSRIDPDIGKIIDFENQRQIEKIILIPSESICPEPVREALSSSFTNLYAEGYPARRMSEEYDEQKILDFDYQLTHYRRYSDRRFYKGVEYADFIESLTQRRIARCFANERVSAHKIFANVQPLSGAAANNSVYAAFLQPGDVILGMHLSHGGHLTHGSEFNRSGKYYRAISYTADSATGKLDYERIGELAREYRPKMIIAGYSAYPWSVSWEKFREIADSVGAYLLADVAHVAGLIVAGVYPNPIGFADAITFTTHKTLCGPRGAVILTTDREKAKLIDDAVFPGEQGGPHINKMAAMGVAFKIAETEEFKKLQRKIVKNAKILALSLARRGLTIAYGGTDTHLLLVDLNAIETDTGYPLKGEVAARILDLCGIVVNKNTIPGDEDASEASGIRLGTPWITQRGFGKKEIEKIAELVSNVIFGIHPFLYRGVEKNLPRGKIQLSLLEKVKEEVKELIRGEDGRGEKEYHFSEKLQEDDFGLLRITGERAKPFLQEISTVDIVNMKAGDYLSSFLLNKEGNLIDSILILRLPPDKRRGNCYLIFTSYSQLKKVKNWMEGLSDGYVLFDSDDLFAKVQGPVVVEDVTEEKENIMRWLAENLGVSPEELRKKANLPGSSGTGALSLYRKSPPLFSISKPYFIGQKVFIRNGIPSRIDKKVFSYKKKEKKVRQSIFHEEHQRLGAKFTNFAGWEMPVYYTSIADEHKAVREKAGLFDVGHMGILEVGGEGATDFLDTVATNYVRWISPGQSQYSFLLSPDGKVIDDIMIYCRGKEKYMIICNAANQEKVLDWLEAVNCKKYIIDSGYPAREVKNSVYIRDLKDKSAGEEQKVDIALQGPESACILQKIVQNEELWDDIKRLQKNEFLEGEVAGCNLMISRTGYTGEKMGFELYLHPKNATLIWGLILQEGKEFGVSPCGLGARDSTRIEAGLPLHGHELAGKYEIDPVEAGYGAFVKYHKAFFIGREVMLDKEGKRTKKIIRFRLNSSSGRMIREDDPVVDEQGRYIGKVTSCALVGDFQIGLAFVDEGIREEENIAIFPLARRKQEGKSPEDLEEGDRISLPQNAVVLPRFLEPE